VPSGPCKVILLDDPEVNACAMPGYILVKKGMLGFVDSEVELASILAHELGHVYAHHSFRRHIRAHAIAPDIKGLVDSLTKLVTTNTTIQTVVKAIADNSAALSLLVYSREDEQEADRYGAHIMYAAGYSPDGIVPYFQKLIQTGAQENWKYFSTHPPTVERIKYLEPYCKAFAKTNVISPDNERFQIIKKRIASLPSNTPASTAP
jgi:predicted Zn-dependent protease